MSLQRLKIMLKEKFPEQLAYFVFILIIVMNCSFIERVIHNHIKNY